VSIVHDTWETGPISTNRRITNEAGWGKLVELERGATLLEDENTSRRVRFPRNVRNLGKETPTVLGGRPDRKKGPLLPPSTNNDSKDFETFRTRRGLRGN